LKPIHVCCDIFYTVRKGLHLYYANSVSIDRPISLRAKGLQPTNLFYHLHVSDTEGGLC